MVFASDPWAVIESALTDRCTGQDLEAAQSFVGQAREYHGAADTARSAEAQPLLYYYGFLNLGKALAIANKRPGIVGRVEHGLQVVDLTAALSNAEVNAFPTGTLRRGQPTVNAFDEFSIALSGSGLAAQQRYRVSELMAQILFGHRLWVEASRRRERFVGLEGVELRHISTANQVWANLVVPERALIWRGRSKESVVRDGDLAPDFDFVRKTVLSADGTPLRVFQQAAPVTYGHRPSDDLMSVVGLVKPKLWRAITAEHPFRRYYLYLSDPGEVRLPQLLSIYTLMFYLGSVTRYNPPLFRRMIDGRYGAFLREFLASQPQQFVYAIACESRQREVSRATGV
jgi:hypothetical protein